MKKWDKLFCAGSFCLSSNFDSDSGPSRQKELFFKNSCKETVKQRPSCHSGLGEGSHRRTVGRQLQGWVIRGSVLAAERRYCSWAAARSRASGETLAQCGHQSSAHMATEVRTTTVSIDTAELGFFKANHWRRRGCLWVQFYCKMKLFFSFWGLSGWGRPKKQ